MIEARNLSKVYGTTLAVDDLLSFDVQPGPGHRVPRAQRGGQDHDDADDPRPGPPERRAR